jgi:Zn-dependent protease
MSDPLAPITAGRGRGMAFRIGDIPVHVSISFLLVLAFLGLQLADPVLIAVWVVVGAASVLLHELGHALAARLAGHAPKVELAGLGGLTSYRGKTSRVASLAITAAGPVVQITAGLLGLPFLDRFGLVYRGDLGEFALSVWVVVSLVWGGLNLVPVLPLDGGQLLRDLLPGSVRTRSTAAHVVSAAIALAGLGWALVAGDTWIALFAGFFAYSNVMSVISLRGAGPAGGEPSAGPGDGADAQSLMAAASQRLEAGDASGWQLVRRAVTAPGPASIRAVAAGSIVAALLRAGRHREAYQAVADHRPGLALDEVVVARALATHPNQVGVRRVVLGWAHERNDARARGIAALLLALGGDVATADQWLAVGPVSPAVRAAVGAHRPPPPTP